MADEFGSPPALALRHPASPSVPVIVCSPHSGRHYAPEFLAQSRLALADLRRSEDAFVDELFADAPSCGAPLLALLWPRCYVDVNREPYELDAAMFAGPLPGFVNGASPRVRSGFGAIPAQVAGAGAIYGARLEFAEAERRLAHVYRPYHDALSDLVTATRAAFGFVLVLDAHSMPSSGAAGEHRSSALPDLVLGDRFGQSCAEVFVAEAERVLGRAGYAVRRNDPYAGGFTTEFYGRPAQGVHALQVEINRALYMDEASLARHAGCARVRADMRGLVQALGALSRPALAAE